MTDAELNARFARLSDEDLQEMLSDHWAAPGGFVATFGFINLGPRMAREILDLRTQLAVKERDGGSMTQFERLLDSLDWKPLPPIEGDDGGEILPHATHEGILELCGHKLKVFQLSDGNRVIEAEDLNNFFREMEKS